MPLEEKLSHWRRVITVEPLIAICVLVAHSRNLIQWEFEDSYFKREAKWQHHDTLVQIVQSTIPIILVLFFGAYSDKTSRRKPFLLLPILGEIAALFGYISCMVLQNQCSQWLNTFLRCVPSIFGRETVLYMAALAVITDVSNPSTISFRVGILYMVEHITMLIAMVVQQNYRQTHWVLVAETGGVLLFGLLYALFWIKETRETATANLSRDKNVFRPKHFLETSTFLLRNYVGSQKTHFLILLHLISTYYLANFGDSFHLLQFAETPSRIHQWIFFVCSCLSTLVVIPLFTRNVLPLRDTTILLKSCAAQVLANILIGAAPNVGVLYLAFFVSILVVLIAVISTSMIFKLGLSNDVGKLAAIVTIFKSSGLSFAFMTYHFLNQTSFKFVYFGAVLFAVLLPLVIWMHVDYKKKEQQDQRDNSIGDNREAFEAHQI